MSLPFDASRPAPSLQLAEAGVLDALPASVAVLDAKGVVVSANAAWRRLARTDAAAFGTVDVGQSYLAHLTAFARAAPWGAIEAREAARGLRSLLGGARSEITAELAFEEECWLRLSATRLEGTTGGAALVMLVDVTDVATRAEALRSSDARFQRMFQDAATGIALVAPDGSFLEANPACCGMFGYSEAELRTLDLLAVSHPEDRVHCVGQMQELIHGQRGSLVLEKRYLRKDGQTLFARVSLSARRDAGGHTRHLIVVFEDITERKRAEEELAHSQALLRLASRVGRVGGWRIDATDFSLSWSDEVRAIHGYPEDFVPKTADEIIALYAPEHRERVCELFHACIEEGTPVDEELQIVRPDGSRVWVRLIGEAVRDAQGKVVQLQGALQDISEHKRAERSLAQLQARIRQLADSLPLIVWIARPDGVVDYANRALADYTGIDDAERPDRGWVRGLHPDDVEPCVSLWRRAVETGEAVAGKYRILRAADGSYRWHHASAMPVLDEDGQVIRWCGTAIDIHDHQLAEEEARRLAGTLITTLESITDAFFTVDAGWRITYVNPEAERAFGRAHHELVGEELWTALPDLAGTPLEGALRRAMGAARRVEFEERCPPLGAWVGGRAYPSRQGLAVYFRDVTERREAREALRASEERFRLLAKATHDAIYDWDLGTGELWWNEGFETLFGYAHDEVGRSLASWEARVHPADRERVVPGLWHAIEAGHGSWSDEYRFQRKDGSYAYVLERGHILRDEDGKPLRMIGGMTDLAERKQSEERLAELAALLDKARDAILVRDLEHRVLYWNRSAERMYGWSAEEALGRSVEALLYRDPDVFRQATEETLRTGAWIGELEHVTKDGRVRVVEGRWTLVRDEQGQPKSILATNTDITERKKLEQQLFRAQRLESIGTLAGGIAHDLNNVLAPILMASQMLRDLELDDDAKEDLSTIEACAQRGAGMVRQLLFFARGVDGQRTQVDLGRIARDFEKLIRETFPKDIDFRLHVPRELWRLTGDPTQLHQLLMNLCVNARDAMPRGGDLVVTLDQLVMDEVYAGMHVEARPGSYLVLKVEDTGTGISPEVLERIFEPFFTTKEVGKGTGLGLSTAHAIVKSHGGFIDVYSEVGRGTTFKVFLPADTSCSEHEPPESGPAELPRGQGELVLVVDDEEPLRLVARRTLERHGYRVLLASHGAEAIALYARHQDEIAVVLTDMAMPVMDGPATIVALKSMNPAVRVIGSSGLSGNNYLAKAMGAGVEHFVPKPYSAETMLRVLREVLSSAPTR